MSEQTLSVRVLLTHYRARTGSAVHALAQPTPPGDGPEGFFTVLNNAIVTTEKVNYCDQNIQSLGEAYIYGQMKFAFNLLQVIILGTIKLSAICFYRRIFRGKTFDYYSLGMIVIVIVWSIAFFFSVLFECRTHFEYLWSTLLELVTHCSDEEKFFNAYAISDVVIDGLILVMPIPMVCLQQTGIVVAVVDFTNDIRYGGCKCRSRTNSLCVVCS